MIDFTTIQTYKVPERVTSTLRQNNDLKKTNKILVGVILCGVTLLLTYQVLKIMEKETAKVKTGT